MNEATAALETLIINRIPGEHIVVAVMGGDGSLAGILDSLLKSELVERNVKTLVFTPLPFGTGNDISRCLGWGGVEGPWAKNLESLC